MAIRDKVLSLHLRRSKDDARSPDHPPDHQDDRTTQSLRKPLPPLNPVTLPLVLPNHLPALSYQGWTTVTFTPSAPSASEHLELHAALQNLFSASKAFFAQEQAHKEQFRTKSKDASEEGWSRVEGEKEFITLRTLDRTPPELRDAVTRAWEIAGTLLNAQLSAIATSLGLSDPSLLTQFSQPCIKFGELASDRTPTMLRMFRYEGSEAKIVAEPHKDLGLLSLVAGDTPGLEVFNRHLNDWFAIEKTYDQESRPSASLLGGRQLEALSNGRYQAGGHLVRAYGAPTVSLSPPISADEVPTSQSNYRYSIVFVLRAYHKAVVDTDKLTTPITGKFANPIKGVSAGEMFAKIRKAHYNINAVQAEREEQRKKLAELKAKEDENTSGKNTTDKAAGVEDKEKLKDGEKASG